MKHFLEVIAESYTGRYRNLSDFTFVFPNKRSGTFFRKYMKEACKDSPRLSPEITTVSDLVVTLSGCNIDSRIDLLFTLYTEYRNTMPELPEDKIPSFEKFASWGDAVLRDFSEADLYGVNAAELFRNIKEYKKIASSFLTEEQVEVLREYFDMDYLPPDPSKFWQTHYNDDGKESQIKNRFRSLWESLGDLYIALTNNLEKRGLTTTGGAYRKAVKRVESDGKDAYRCRKFVFVGFNVLSKMEFLLFKRLSQLTTVTEMGEEPFADFVWDITGPLLRPDSAGAKFVHKNLHSFPKPHWLNLDDCNIPSDFAEDSNGKVLNVPEITVISSPSYSLQAKISGRIATEWYHNDAQSFLDAKTALVLPDENLLLPLLYSIPDDVEYVNLTMGYPLRLTSTMSFIDRIKRLQNHRTTSQGSPAFFHEDILLLLSHPFAQAILGMENIATIRDFIIKYRLFTITPQQISLLIPEEKDAKGNVRLLFSILPPDSPASEVIHYLDTLLQRIQNQLDESESAFSNSSLDKSHINVYRDALRRLAKAADYHKISLKYNTVLSLADRLLSGESVRFEGEPLKGLQVMGLLETRSLDFDNIIIPSMNERIMPRRIRHKSFIPESIRRGFGMPSSGYEEGIFAYYFYRLLSRAKKVVLIYDSRTGEGKGGDISRYILQLKHLIGMDIKRISYSFTLRQGVNEPMSIEKDDFTFSRLNLMMKKNSKVNLSASTIMNYCECPMKFFFKSIAGIPDTAPPKEFMDELTIGNVFHAVMEQIYKLPDDIAGKSSSGNIMPEPLFVDKNFILNFLNNTDYLKHLITRHINYFFFNRRQEEDLNKELDGEPAMTARRILGWVKRTLQKDLDITPFKILGTELRGTEQLSIPATDDNSAPRLVNITYAIDRIDQVNLNGTPVTRIVDYKTGVAHLKATSMEDVFSGEYNAKNILQPLLYSHLLNHRLNGPQPLFDERPLRPEIYSMIKTSETNPVFTPDIKIESHLEELEANIRKEIMDNGGDHTQADMKVSNITERLQRKKIKYEGNIINHLDIAPLFLPRLYRVINEIFNPEIPFTSTQNDKTCKHCAYAPLCRK